MPIHSPFASSFASPGNGQVVLGLLSPSIPTLTTLTYKYPLKLLSRTPAFTPESSVLPAAAATKPVHLYLLTYGGGLLPGDHIDVSITLCPRTRLVVTTPQGSTKIFKTAGALAGQQQNRWKEEEDDDDKSRQTLDVHIGSEAALCYLPDPSAPFKDSRYEQVQTFTVDGNQTGDKRSSLCVLDWVTQGRASRGENWDFHSWKGRNEVWSSSSCDDDATGKTKRRLLLRDSVILDDESRHPHRQGPSLPSYNFNNDNSNNNNNNNGGLIRERTHPHGIMGTLILYGPVFDLLGSFFIQTFASQPRIGGRNWSSSTSSVAEPKPADDVIWTAARVRAGFVLVKFGAKDHETAREWLGGLIRGEGNIAREFGEEALFCL
ncbi:urease accessory protein UreD [Elaphomyces granulatus]